MPSLHGQYHSNMEKIKSVESLVPKQSSGETSTFICTECGDGFSQYPSLLAHMVLHGPVESFPLDGSSNGFDVPREYVLQENGTLTIMNGFEQSQYTPIKPISPVAPPSHFLSPSKSVLPTLPPPPPSCKDVSREKPTVAHLSLDKPSQDHYHCEICSRTFNSHRSLRRHQQYGNVEQGYKCTLCCQNYKGRGELMKHLKEHAHEQFHCCADCGKRFLKVNALNAHYKKYHLLTKSKPMGKSRDYQQKRVEKTYPCKKCGFIFFWFSDFQIHSLHHCIGKELDLPLPSKIQVNSNQLEESMYEKHQSNDTDEKPLDGIFLNVTNYAIDVKSFTPYRCGLCGDRFQNLTDLKEHHLTHQTQEEMDKLNDEQQKTFRRVPRRIRLGTRTRRRRKVNSGSKQFPCKQCHRVFNHSSSLSRHMRFHKGTMHTCALCGRHFSQLCEVKRHLAMYHKAELEKKPGLKRMTLSHGRTALEEEEHHGKQTEKSKPRGNYKCQECGKKFGLLCVYHRHLRYHKKETSLYHKCPQCPAQFKNQYALERHLRNHTRGAGEGEGEVGHTFLTADPKQGPVPEKANTKDVKNIDTDHTREDKATSAEILYECTECTETFASLETFLEHQISHGSENHG